jgi:hypothetical protein
MMFEQAVLPIQDEKTFAEIRQALDETFAAQHVASFLRRVIRTKLRVRQFEAILANGFLGAETPAKYAALSDTDRGQVREQYLRRVEQVEPELRAKFLKAYAYY